MREVIAFKSSNSEDKRTLNAALSWGSVVGFIFGMMKGMINLILNESPWTSLLDLLMGTG
ncbi:MAG: hypothetical protein QMD22_01675 [archaeon]|nr:hypothetical protein [archaeon]